TATATDWPEVTPPGGGAVASATSTGRGLATAVPAGSVAVAERPASAGAAGPEAAPAEEAQGSLAAGVQGTPHPAPARPEPSRPEPSRPEPSGPAAARRDTRRTNRPGAARPDAATSAQRPGPAASSVDEAWLAGASVSE